MTYPTPPQAGLPPGAPVPAPGPVVWAPPPPRRPGPAPGLEYAGFWIRTGAYLIDAIPLIIAAIIVFIPLITAMASAMASIPYPSGASFYSPEYAAYNKAVTQAMVDAMPGFYPAMALLQVVSAAYFVGFWTWRGQTPGMMAVGLRVARDRDGTPPGLSRAILRYVGYIVSWFGLFIGFFWVAADARKQGWHDKIASTVVVRRVG